MPDIEDIKKEDELESNQPDDEQEDDSDSDHESEEESSTADDDHSDDESEDEEKAPSEEESVRQQRKKRHKKRNQRYRKQMEEIESLKEELTQIRNQYTQPTAREDIEQKRLVQQLNTKVKYFNEDLSEFVEENQDAKELLVGEHSPFKTWTKKPEVSQLAISMDFSPDELYKIAKQFPDEIEELPYNTLEQQANMLEKLRIRVRRKASNNVNKRRAPDVMGSLPATPRRDKGFAKDANEELQRLEAKYKI